LFSSCENLIAEEGSILFSSNQIKTKPNELPVDIIIYATTSQILAMKSDSLSAIKKNTKEITLPTLQQLNILKKQKKRISIWSSAKNLLFVAFRRSLK
jgi:hypothetical protein